MVAAAILANGVTEILKKLSSVVANEITLVWDFNDHLKDLHSTLNMILAVMEDAEKKQVSDKSVRLWMEELKAISYDAEDILDDYSYEIICKRTQTGKVRKPSLFFRRRMADKINEINEKLKKSAKRKNVLGLQTSTIVGSSSSLDMNMTLNRETHAFVALSWKIVGRENDKSTIIKMLLEEEKEEEKEEEGKEEEENTSNNIYSTNLGGGKHVSVIPIVGMGGLGKTTMAQLVYNDDTINSHFDIKLWICVSDPFDVKKIFKNIAKSLDEKAICDDAITMHSIICGFQKHLTKKKFLLVLDDVRNENFGYWHDLKTPLMVGAKGSKILVTTRSVKVAELMLDKFPHYELRILNHKDSWSLFQEITFGHVAGVVETPKLVNIGKKMVERCKGLPLAVIFLSSLLRFKKTENEWKIIQDTKIWHESNEGKNSANTILPSLRLSYDYLPSHLKNCFSYCCLFPKDWKIERETLIQLWMAEGFLVESPEKNAMSMEEIGNEYFHSLLSNFFFQEAEKDEEGNIATCKMHNLIHDLARSVVGNHECLMIENVQDVDCISEATRRLNLSVNLDDGEMLAKVLEALKKAKNLRTVFVKPQTIILDIGKTFKENKRLRVLDLSGSEVATESTSSPIGGLKHLRYLHLPSAVIIPKRIGRLRFDRRQDRLRPHPNLRTLKIAGFQGSNLTRWIQDSSCLPNLVDLTLSYSKCEQVAGFGALPSLRSLRLESLEELKCIGNEFYSSSSAAAGGESGSSSNNTASTGEASSTATATTTIAFPSLKKLTLDTMQSLEKWFVPAPPLSTTTTGATTNNCFPLLEEITIEGCPFLTTITPTTTIFPSLKVLNLSNIDGSAAKTLVTNNLNSLTSLRLTEIPKLITLPHQGLMENNNTLLSLAINDCPDFKGFLPLKMDDSDQGGEGGGGQQLQEEVSQVVSSSSCSSSSSSSCLQSLTLYDCPAMMFYPNIRCLTSLRKLLIQECEESKSLQDELTCSSSSSSSSSSSLKHLKHAKFLKNKTARAVVCVWRKPNSFMK